MEISKDAASYANDAAERLVKDLDEHKAPKSQHRWLFAEFLLAAYQAGHRKGLEDAHKTKWFVVRKNRQDPDEPPHRFGGALRYDFAMDLVVMANKLSEGDHYYEIEPSIDPDGKSLEE